VGATAETLNAFVMPACYSSGTQLEISAGCRETEKPSDALTEEALLQYDLVVGEVFLVCYDAQACERTLRGRPSKIVVGPPDALVGQPGIVDAPTLEPVDRAMVANPLRVGSSAG